MLILGALEAWSSVDAHAAALPATLPVVAAHPEPPGDLRVEVAQHPGLFGTIEFKAPSLDAVPHWLRVIQKIQAEQDALHSCDAAPGTCESRRIRGWRAKLQSLRGRQGMELLQEINRFINQDLPYRTDNEVYGRSDYWAAPVEFMRNAGDCEDYAITKFVSLLELGFANDQMRIVVLKDTLRNLGHAVLAVDLDGHNYILDSLIDNVVLDQRLPQYQPQYSVNLTTRWAHMVPQRRVAANH